MGLFRDCEIIANLRFQLYSTGYKSRHRTTDRHETEALPCSQVTAHYKSHIMS